MRQPPKKVNRDSGLSVAIVGLRFGAAFVPIYLHHPDVANVGIIDPVRERLDPVLMFLSYLGLMLFYRSKGGYKPKDLVGEGRGQ